MQEITILKEPSPDFPFVLLDKPAGLSSAPAARHDSDSAFAQAAALFPSLLAVAGRNPAEHGLLHRLDKDTAGLLLIAATQESYGFLLNEQAAGRFWKTYRADCIVSPENAESLGGFPPQFEIPNDCNASSGRAWEVQSYFRSFGIGGKEVRPVAERSGMAARKKAGAKLYRTYICGRFYQDGCATVSCRIFSGYRHQVRCHLAWCGLPVIGDELYNAECRMSGRGQDEKKGLHFFATGLDFYNPAENRRVHFEREPSPFTPTLKPSNAEKSAEGQDIAREET